MNRYFSIFTVLSATIQHKQLSGLNTIKKFSSISTPAMDMKSVKQDAFGEADALYVGTREKPSPANTQVLIKVRGSALNRADIIQRKGKYPNQKDMIPLGLEVSGKIAEIGDAVEKEQWSINQEVIALVPGGGYSEYAVVDARHVMPKPQSVSLMDASGVPEVWLTAYQLLCFVGEVKSGDMVLIHGGGSGVGTAAIQLVSLLGAKCIVTAGSEEKINHAIKLGAKTGFNYKAGNFDDKLLEFTKGKGVDLVLDCVGASFWKQNVKSLKMDGRWVLYGLLGGGVVEGNILGSLLSKRISIRPTTLMSRSNDYKAKLVSEFSKNVLPHFGTKVFPIIDKTFSIDDVVKAHKYLESNQNIGKVLLDINPN